MIELLFLRIIFVIDGSGSIPSIYYKQISQHTQLLIDKYKHMDAYQFNDRINTIHNQDQGGTNTYIAFENLAQIIEQSKEENCLVIFISDGYKNAGPDEVGLLQRFQQLHDKKNIYLQSIIVDSNERDFLIKLKILYRIKIFLTQITRQQLKKKRKNNYWFNNFPDNIINVKNSIEQQQKSIIYDLTRKTVDQFQEIQELLFKKRESQTYTYNLKYIISGLKITLKQLFSYLEDYFIASKSNFEQYENIKQRIQDIYGGL